MGAVRAARRPPPVRQIATAKVRDPQVARALSDVDLAVRDLQRDASLPRELAKGDLLYVDANGRVVRLPIGSAGQTLTVGADGVPEWS